MATATEAGIDRRTRPSAMQFSTWRAPDGWLYRRMAWPRPAGIPARGSLLFAGGRGDFVEKYLEAFGAWHARGWAVASFDWRGQGKSRGDIVGGHLGTFDILIEDLAALLADWMATTPPPHVVVSHSMGAHLLLRLLIEQPVTHRSGGLAAVVLTAPMFEVNSGGLPAWSAALIADTATRLGLGERPLWGSPLARAPAGSKRQRVLTGCVERYEDECFWWGAEPDFAPAAPTLGWVRAAYRSARAFTPAALGGVNLPMLLVGAQEDRLVRGAAIRRAAGLLPRAELMMVAGCAHEILRERDEVRAAVMARIDTFLDAHTQ